MKKVMFAAAVAAAGLAFGIESANTVGYTTKTIPAGKYMMIAVQFDKVGGTALKFDEAFQLNVTGPAAWVSEDDEECIPGWYANAPCLKIPNGVVSSGYRDLYYSSKAWNDEAGEFVEGWADAGGDYVASAEMLNGYGVWMVAGSEDLTVTINGEVKGAATATFSAATGYNMMKLPYPVSLNAGDSKIDWNLTGPAAWVSEDDEECIAGWYTTAPAIKIPNGTVSDGYRDLYYSSKAWNDAAGEFVEGWSDAGGDYVSNAVIPEGMAFWFVVPSPVTSTVTK